MYGEDLHPIFEQTTSYFETDSISRLEASEKIRRTKAFYCFFLDAKDWDGYQRIFTDDAILEVPSHGLGERNSIIQGAENIKHHVQNAVGNVITNHHCHTPIIDFTSKKTALAVWAMEDMLRFPAGGPAKELHGLGHYFERYQLINDYWLISHLRLTRLRLEITP